MSDDLTNDRLIFWRNWFDGVDRFPDDMRLAWYDAVMRFAFLAQEPDEPTPDDPLSAIRWNAVQMVRAAIDISRKRRQIGAKGGSKRKAKRKQKRSKPEAKAKQEQEQVEEQVEEQVQEQYANSISATTRARKSLPTINQFVTMGKTAGVPEEFARQLYEDLSSVGWVDSDGRPVRAGARYLKAAWIQEQKKSRGACEITGASIGDIPDAR